MIDAAPATRRVIYCDCAHANVIPAEVKNAALRAILERGLEFQAVTDLCRMSAHGDERLADIAGAETATVVACQPRAVKGLFERTGHPLKLDGERVAVLNMRELGADAIVEKLPRPVVPPAPRTPVEIETDYVALRAHLTAEAQEEAGWKPWFPVIDYDRCTSCGLCANFCIFGVYKIGDNATEGFGRETKNGKVLLVENPTNCKTDCPACARVCPETAIMFPKHDSGPRVSAIAGGDQLGDGEDAAVDMGGKMAGDAMGFLRGRSRKQRSRFARFAPEAAKLCACAAENGGLADLGIPEHVLAANADLIQKAITENPDLVNLAGTVMAQAKAMREAKASGGTPA